MIYKMLEKIEELKNSIEAYTMVDISTVYFDYKTVPDDEFVEAYGVDVLYMCKNYTRFVEEYDAELEALSKLVEH